jgi:serine/threonine protein kinase
MMDGIGHDEAADVWALGILMHEMLVGETPFARYGYMVLASGEKQPLPDGPRRILGKIATLRKKVTYTDIDTPNHSNEFNDLIIQCHL